MDQEQDMERFSTDNDFIDGEWIDGEFFSRGQRKKRVQSREEALYGYASSASDSDREERRRGKRRNRIINDSSRSSKLMRFVPGAVQNVGDSHPPEADEAEASTSASASDNNSGKFGLGFKPASGTKADEGNPGFGLGFKPKLEAEEEEEENPGAGLGYNSKASFGLGYAGGSGLGYTSKADVDEKPSFGLGYGGGSSGFGYNSKAEVDEKPRSSGLGYGGGSSGLGFNSKPEVDEKPRSSGLGYGAGSSGLGYTSKADVDEKPRSSGLGYGGGGSGLGYNSGNGGGGGKGGFGLGFKPGSDLEDEKNPMLDTPLGRKIHESVQQKPAFKPKSSGKPAFVWEKSSNQFASRMLEKMGWDKSKGLGKNKEGMVKHIETIVRPKNMGLGFGDFTEASNAKPAEEDTEEGNLSQKPKANERMWLKKNRNKVKEYITADELLKRQGEKGGGRVVEKVLDMTGPQVRVVTDMRNLNADTELVEDDTPMPELQHNLRLLVDLAASDVQHYDSKIRHDKQSVEILRKEKERLEKQLELQSRAVQVMQTVMVAVNALKSERKLTPDGAAGVFRRLKAEYPEEYKTWNISAIALSHALPLTTPRFQGWQPLVQPSRGIDTLLVWREVFLEDEEPIFADVDSSSFTRLVMETVMPHIRRAVVNWDPRDPEPLLGFFDVWEKLLPASVLQNILDYLVLPKLNAEVDAWNPLQDTVPVHAWIHPWLPLLSSKMEQMCGVIRVKLDSVLEAWDPSDSSAFLMLSPWHQVFDAGSWDQLLLRKIIPKLNYALDLLVIDPAQQQLEPFNWVMSWSSVIPAHYMIRMLEERFFPKWLEVLFRWLSSNPDFGEVSEWYLGWKSVLPAELVASERVRVQLQAALDLMNQAVEEVPLVLKQMPQRQSEVDHPVLRRRQQRESEVEEVLSLKEMVEGFALENDVRFVPKVGRRHEGLQVYGFGSVSVSVDNHKQVILAQAGERWSSVSMADLLEMHHAKKGGKWNS